MKWLNELKVGDTVYYARTVSLSNNLRKILPAKILNIYNHVGFNGKQFKIFDLKVIDLDYQKSVGYTNISIYSWDLNQSLAFNVSTDYKLLEYKIHD
jgi:hypothetical protein